MMVLYGFTWLSKVMGLYMVITFVHGWWVMTKGIAYDFML